MAFCFKFFLHTNVSYLHFSVHCLKVEIQNSIIQFADPVFTLPHIFFFVLYSYHEILQTGPSFHAIKQFKE